MQINGEILEKFFLLFDKKISDREKNFLLKGEKGNNNFKNFLTQTVGAKRVFERKNFGNYYGLNLNKNSKKFLEKFSKYKFLFSICPFIKGIFIGNTIAFGSAKESSDIDLFIVFENGRIWIGRFILTFLLQIFGVRRHGKKTKGRFCLSFFASEKGAFELENIQIEKDKDIYLAIWTVTLIPVFGSKKFFEEFFEKNKWVENYGIKFLNEKNFPNDEKKFLKKFLEKILNFNFIENFLRRILKPRSENKKNKIKNNYGIIISDDYLKFHDNDKRREIMEKFI